ncbi:MAG: phosphonate C-P lyase system protein PhnH [Rubricella sp.]
MIGESLTGGFADAAPDAARAFRACLDAMARPGTIQDVAGPQPPAPLGIAAGIVALTLCDPETGVWLAPSVDTGAVREWLAFHTGARLAGPAHADFHFGTWAEMPWDTAKIGTPDYPDRSATFVIETPLSDAGATIAGPGIKETASIALPDTAILEANAKRFPLGIDLILTDGARLAAMPRTTRAQEG